MRTILSVLRSTGYSILTLSVLLLITSAAVVAAAESDEWKVPARAAKRKNPLTPDAECVAVGQELYAKECASCHGKTGRGDGPAANELDPKPRNFTDTSVAKQTDGALFWKIGEGHRPMPGFRMLISEDGRWHVVCYLRTLASPPSTQAATKPTTQSASPP